MYETEIMNKKKIIAVCKRLGINFHEDDNMIATLDDINEALKLRGMKTYNATDGVLETCNDILKKLNEVEGNEK